MIRYLKHYIFKLLIVRPYKIYEILDNIYIQPLNLIVGQFILISNITTLIGSTEQKCAVVCLLADVPPGTSYQI